MKAQVSIDIKDLSSRLCVSCRDKLKELITQELLKHFDKAFTEQPKEEHSHD